MSLKFDFGFAARVRIWKDTGEPLDVIFGNGWGRNFFFLSFKEQTNHSPNDYEKVASDSIVKPKSVIRISLCRTAKRNPLIFPI